VHDKVLNDGSWTGQLKKTSAPTKDRTLAFKDSNVANVIFGKGAFIILFTVVPFL
jgi:hypothetical protein